MQEMEHIENGHPDPSQPHNQLTLGIERNQGLGQIIPECCLQR